MYSAIDDNDDGFVQESELIRIADHAKKAEKKEKAVKNSSSESSSSESEEKQTFINFLAESVAEEEERYDEFREDLGLEKNELQHLHYFFYKFAQNEWHRQMGMQQRLLLVKTIASTILDDARKMKLMLKDPFNLTLAQILEDLDMSFVIPVIINISPKVFRNLINRDSKLSEKQQWLCELIESARHQKFISMLSTAIN